MRFKGYTTIIGVVALLSACATPPVSVALTPVEVHSNSSVVELRWSDSRAEPVVSLRMNQGGAEEVVRNLQLSTPLSVAFIDHVRAAANRQGIELRPLAIRLDDLQLRDRVGFLAEDKLSCTVTSEISDGGAASNGSHRVTSRVDGITSMSPMIATVSQLILDACLKQHAADIVAIELTTATSSR